MGTGDTDDVTVKFTVHSDLVLGVPAFTADADAGLYAVDAASYTPASCPSA
jgi:hypothetical protein